MSQTGRKIVYILIFPQKYLAARQTFKKKKKGNNERWRCRMDRMNVYTDLLPCYKLQCGLVCIYLLC